MVLTRYSSAGIWRGPPSGGRGRGRSPGGVGVVVKVEPIGILWMMSAGWLNRLAGTSWRAQKALPEGRLVAGMKKSTLLDSAVRGFGGAAAGGGIDESERQRQLFALCDPGGARRRLFGVGEGPAEAVAEAKQERTCVQSSTPGWSGVGEGNGRQEREKRDAWRCGVRKYESGLHEPADCTKICTNRAPLALRRLHASSTLAS